MITWLRESSGWTIEDLSRNLNLSIEQVTKWEEGSGKPTLNELKRIAKAFHRPLAAFFLPTPILEPPLPTDFRRLPGETTSFSKKTLLAIRKSRNLQKLSCELLTNLGASLEPDIITTTQNENSERIAYTVRVSSDILVETQIKWKGSHAAFNAWRQWIESQNILVFQFPMEIEELRGLTLMEIKPYAIVINSSDSIQARIFTLLHEYAHILIHEPSLCTPENPSREDHKAGIEAWCNNFAGSFLMPKDAFIRAFDEFEITRISTLANRFKVSISAALTRAVICDKITNDTYNSEISKLNITHHERSSSGGGGEFSDEKAFRERGVAFVSLVIENSQRGYISNNDVLDYLDIKTHHLNKILTSSP
jgi:Zn-dependent peptidase ImmA (M78 family)/DNA-binding XRE family transcriptional regulator